MIIYINVDSPNLDFSTCKELLKMICLDADIKQFVTTNIFINI